MQRLDGHLVLSPSDLAEHLACAHLTGLRRRVADGELAPPHRDDPHAEIVARRGDEHEAVYLEALRARGVEVATIERPADRSAPALLQRAEESAEAMRAGVPVVYQATFFDGTWRGHADFLERVERPSALGSWSYEVTDTKLAREARPPHVLQLCAYSEQVERLQGSAPEHAHLVLGDGRREAFRLADFAAAHRRAARRLEAVLAGPAPDTYPEPVEHCQVCPFAPRCWARWRADDHLSLVAGARRDHRAKLAEAGLASVRALAGAPPDDAGTGLAADSFERLRSQAELQVRTRDTRALQRRDLAPARGRGYARLPAPDPGDVFFDLEGDPFVEGGLEYLWGYELRAPDGGWAFHDGWAHDRVQERDRFEELVDLVTERRERYPGLHVYHYAPHEAATLKRLAAHHATREDAVDELLRDGVLVDLYAVLRQAMQVGQERYSLKWIEPFYMAARDTEVTEAGGSIVAYEGWLTTEDPDLLEAIRRYNHDDVVSTRLLRDWLLACRAQAEAGGAVFVGEPEEEERPEPAWWAEHRDRLERLGAGLPDHPAADDADQAERRGLAALLDYHRREAKPEWWRHFELRALTDLELIDDREAIGGLERDPGRPPERVTKQSLGYWLRFPEQEQRLGLGEVLDPATGEKAGEIVRFDPAGTSLLLKRTPKLADAPLPTALIGPKPIFTPCQRGALAEVAEAVLAGEERFEAVRSVLRRERPRVRGVAAAEALLPGSKPVGEDELVGLVERLEASQLPVQGPPGAGKTYLGARLVVALLARGWRIGVGALGHKAIHNLLAEIEAVAVERGVEVRGFHRAGDPDSRYPSAHGLVESDDDNKKASRRELNLVAGTAWLFSRPELRSRFDLLVIDEAGQLALADAVAMGTSAERLVFLGDPQQLPQVTKAAHPGSAGCSVLEHLLAGRATVAPDRGVFLAETRRMHPAVCAYVSEAFYDGHLGAVAECARRRIEGAGSLSGAGLRVLAVEHAANRQASREEAEAIAAACRELAGAHVVDERGQRRPLEPHDILVVAPYNLAVRAIARAVPAGVRVGTVDKFQGQEAAVAFFAMTSSTSEDAPRGPGFLFSSHRLNVAVSRAQCLAVLVASPRLLDTTGRSVDQLRLVNATARFVELAS